MATNPDPNNIASYKGPYVNPTTTRVPAPLGPFGSNAPMAALVQTASPIDANAPATREQDVVNTHQGVVCYDKPGVDHEPGDQGATKPANPPFWPIEDDADGIPRSRDPYRVDGMIGQDFTKNQG